MRPVAHPQKGKGEHDGGDTHGREDAEMPVRPDILLIFSHHLPPTRGRGTNAYPNEAQRRFCKNRLRDAKGERDDDRREGIRQQMADNNRQIAALQRRGPLHKTLAL